MWSIKLELKKQIYTYNLKHKLCNEINMIFKSEKSKRLVGPNVH